MTAEVTLEGLYNHSVCTMMWHCTARWMFGTRTRVGYRTLRQMGGQDPPSTAGGWVSHCKVQLGSQHLVVYCLMESFIKQ